MTKKQKQVKYDIVYGINPIIELLRAKKRKVIALYTTKSTPKGWKRLLSFLPKYPISTSYVTRDVLSKMAGTSDHQGVLAYASPFVYRKKLFEPASHPRLLLLDSIQDVRNLGAILRSAYCTGINGVVIGTRGSAGLSATALKASAGYAEHLEIYQASSILSIAGTLKKQGYELYLATFEGVDARTVSYQTPLCIVIGSEGVGITPQLSSFGVPITLPQIHDGISYNASVAAGILLFLVSFMRN